MTHDRAPQNSATMTGHSKKDGVMKDESEMTAIAEWVTTTWYVSFPSKNGLFGLLPSVDPQTQWEEKQQDILNCLDGSKDDKDLIDLWKLRQLALTRGGLICPSLRKRAWPKLTGIHSILLSSNRKPQPQDHRDNSMDSKTENDPVPQEPSSADVEALLKDVRRTVWNVEDHLNANEEHVKVLGDRETETADTSTTAANRQHAEGQRVEEHQSHGDSRRVSFAATTTESSCSSFFNDSLSSKEERLLGKLSTSQTVSAEGELIKWRKPSRREQKILFHLILSVLKAESGNHGAGMTRLHYFKGLQNLSALLMINVMSPSLCSMILRQLTLSHLRDTMSDEHMVLTAIHGTLLPLLEQVDPALYGYLSETDEGGLLQHSLPGVCYRWVSCWFARDIPNVQLVSRLMDVFMASHPLMPIYISVAMLTHAPFRAIILQTNHDAKATHGVIRSLPRKLATSMSLKAALEAVEDMIEIAISYMNRVPPQALMEPKPNEFVTGLAPPPPPPTFFKAALLHPPAWTTTAVAPTDWALLQQGKNSRSIGRSDTNGHSKQPEQKQEEKDDQEALPLLPSPEYFYPLALAASGQANKTYLHALKLVSLCVVIGVLFGSMLMSNLQFRRRSYQKGVAYKQQKKYQQYHQESRNDFGWNGSGQTT